MARLVTPPGSAHKYWRLAAGAGLVDQKRADQEIARLEAKRPAARRPSPGRPSAPTPDAAAYTAHVSEPHAPRAQSSSSLRKAQKKPQNRRNRYRSRQRQLLERYLERLLGEGQRDACPRPIPLRAWRAIQLVREAPSKSAARARAILLAHLHRWYVERIRKAAFRPEPARPGGRAPERAELRRRSERSRPALRILDLGIFLWLVSVPTRRRGFARVVTGMGRGVFCSALRDFWTGDHASLSTVFGVDPRTEIPGAAPALEQAGALHYSQVPADRARAADRGPSGYAYNAYWIRRGPANDQVSRRRGLANDASLTEPDWLKVLDWPGDPPTSLEI